MQDDGDIGTIVIDHAHRLAPVPFFMRFRGVCKKSVWNG